jgi:single-stranded DNA-binding protein
VNKVLLSGTIRQVDVRETTAGVRVANVSLEVEDEKPDGSALRFIVDVAVWGKEARALASSRSPGDEIEVEGRLTLDRWERDGSTRQKLKVTCSEWK